MTPTDETTLALLRRQCSDLTSLLMRLERARAELVPEPGIWSGFARHAFDQAVDTLAQTVDAGCAALRSARDHTRTAIDVLVARG